MVLSRFRSRLTSLINYGQRIQTTYGTDVRNFSYFLFVIGAVALPIGTCIKDYVFEIHTVTGASMYPYLNADIDRTTKGDVVYIKKLNGKEDIQRGMIISFWSPYHPEVRSVKRVIAIEGDRVVTKAPYPHPFCDIPPNHIWVEGDGRHLGKQSLDSNHYGPIPKSLILGKMTRVLWPWHSAGTVRWQEWHPKTKVIRRVQQQDFHWR